MARIPLYNQGRGSTQQLATGSLSPTANVGAFAAPGQALASFANSAGQIAFDFGMAERRKQDEDAIQNTNAKFVEDYDVVTGRFKGSTFWGQVLDDKERFVPHGLGVLVDKQKQVI